MTPTSPLHQQPSSSSNSQTLPTASASTSNSGIPPPPIESLPPPLPPLLDFSPSPLQRSISIPEISKKFTHSKSPVAVDPTIQEDDDEEEEEKEDTDHEAAEREEEVVAQFNADQLLTERPHVSELVRDLLVHRARDFNIVLDDVAITHCRHRISVLRFLFFSLSSLKFDEGGENFEVIK